MQIGLITVFFHCVLYFNSKYEIYQFLFGFVSLFEPNSVHKWVGAGQGGPHYVFPPPQENVLCPLMNWAPVMILCGMSCASLIVDEQVVVFSEYKCTQVFLGCKFLLGLATLYMVLVTLSTKPITSSVWQCVYLCLPVCMWLWIWVHYLVKRLHHHHMVWWPSLPSI